MKIKVILVEDDTSLQTQIVDILNTAPDIECLFAVASAEEALKKIPLHKVDVILMDINLPRMSGIDCLPALRKKVPQAEILVLTGYEEDDNIFRALKAGACGYLIKSSRTNELFEAIRTVHSGGSSFTSHIARKVVRHFQHDIQVESINDKLSPSEREVLQLVASGYIYKEIAESMNLTPQTVKTYMKRICVKLQVHSKLEAVMKYRS